MKKHVSLSCYVKKMFIFFYLFIFLFSFLFGILFLGRHLYSFWFSIVICIFLSLTTIYIFIVITVCLYSYILYDICLIMVLDIFTISFTFFCNTFYLIILFLINIVFCFIIFYAFYYMYFDIMLSRFFHIFWWFVLCMNIFIISYDLITAYCGWELLGLFSFFLISYFWYRFYALKYGFKAFLISKLGDIFFLLSIIITTSTVSYSTVVYHYLVLFCLDTQTTWIQIILIIICAFSKSTQFGMHIWLPDAMEGPIPVSALIHAATLVVCGIILVTFFSWTIDFWFGNLIPIIGWSALILVMMSMCVFYNFDAKRYIAFSTICQISFSMFCCLSLDLYIGCLFFCYHMFYKATLFIVMGVWIHFFFGLQDIRLYFFTYFCSCILARFLLIFALFNSCSLWFLCGFYCKDLLLSLIMMLSFFFVAEIMCICILFIMFTIIYNYFMLFFLCFVFKCFCLVNTLFLLFDFECCLVYCFICTYMCFILIFFILDLLYFLIFSSPILYVSINIYHINLFDISSFVIFNIILISFMYYGSLNIYIFNVDCIMFFWRTIIIIIIWLNFIIFTMWYLICFSLYLYLFVWNFVIYCRYNLKYSLFICILISLYL